ncbi:MAG: hypothetical protein JGK17_21725 [Microcoleus sp. PH2017_10_PVI_O_A]|uniref:hypothetical protein n=1 Tax=unclassified Microcoleus TaxID=2642155 RepID=UPI001E145967|nr:MULTISPECIES: hypothetical protein [unclassified Microcoleus]TAE78545.1 MAG: hypothetical protein EAZ83_24590 [Oscillatoriales cyanobacterium]MCC3408157.1 hypothetical protein [Microcoleus sp. PH2017_10_PVI_O_A]MCC3462847.1 hypothetical protein [Microcoleus sp. PH2017_11_PCY_U_A]MCC3480701.1 hypothetical protein [Microcoleus sp. PH2017_12_PCY_D_A]MCC3530627.1 hypothetical protein [Microcoleus sp. PH2017_21_RUC_O_A]
MIVLDVQPLLGGGADYRAKYTRSIAQFLQVHQPHLPWAGDLTEEAPHFFQAGVAVDYLAADVEKVDRAEAVTDRAKLDSILQAQLRYLPYCAEKKTGSGNVEAVLRRGID